jgi:hypothetical protein
MTKTKGGGMRSRVFGAIVLCMFFLAGAVYAQDPAPDMPEQARKMMPPEQIKDMSKCNMRGMGCPGMMGMGKEMVATSDGGIIVLVGNKLYKYDKDLNLKKEVELKIDKQMMEKCRLMCGQMEGMKEGMKSKVTEGDGG